MMVSNRRCCLHYILTLLLVIIIFLILYIYTSDEAPNTSPPFPVAKMEENAESMIPKVPLILAYTPYHHTTIFGCKVLKSLLECKYTCRISEDKTLYPIADVAIFHAQDFQMDPLLYSHINPNRLNIFYSREAGCREWITPKNVPKDFFNATMTFRRDSTFWKPYDRFERILPGEENNSKLVWNNEEVERILAKKSKLALQFVSNCKTHSKREVYVQKMLKYTDITLYGNCSKNPFPKDITVNEEYEKHYFYLAFENSVCKDYITEKFWRMKKLIVPVVLKRSILDGIIPNEYFIAADDFDSPKDLVDRLKYLQENPNEYKKYLSWTQFYKKSLGDDSREYCKICEMAVKKQKSSIENIQDWWENQAGCEKDFARTLLL